MVLKVNYSVLGNIGNVEIRQYPEIVLATVTGLGENEAFGLLFRYISGANKTRKKVEMTAPVITSQEIEMTAPVISRENCMAFVLPPKFNFDTAPEPSDPKVILKRISARKMAVLRFRGYTGKNVIGKRTKELFVILKTNGIKTAGNPFLMRYNPPFIPGIFRRNEIGVEIRD